MNIRVLVLAVFCGAFAAVSFGKTLYVSSTATGGGDGSEANPYTMSEAWKNVKGSDTIQLADGTYVEETVRGDSAAFTVRDKPNVTFQGNVKHPENVIIDLMARAFAVSIHRTSRSRFAESHFRIRIQTEVRV